MKVTVGEAIGDLIDTIQDESKILTPRQDEYIIGKMFKFKLDKLLLASNVCIGEPTTAIAMSIA